MNLIFADTMEADRQDRACGLLVSLSLLADTAKRRGRCNGSMSYVYQHELEHHYERALYDALRILGVSIGRTEIANSINVERIKNKGHEALMDILEEYEESFDLEVE